MALTLHSRHQIARAKAAGRGVVATLVLVAGLPAVSVAQTPAGGIAPAPRSERPYRGLFGSGVGSTTQLLTFETTLGIGSADNPIAAQPSGGGPPGARDGGTGNGSSSTKLDYSLSGGRWLFNANNLFVVDYYSDYERNQLLPREILGGALSFFRPKTTLTLTQNFKNLPELSLSDLFDSENAPTILPNHEFGFSVVRYKRYFASLDIGQQLSKRARVDGTAGYAKGVLPDKSWTILLFTGNLNYNLTKGLVATAGYAYGGQKDEGLSVPQEREHHPRATFGLNYNRPLSFSRRTRLSFSTGTAATHDKEEKKTIYYLIGGAFLNHEFGRTWNASLGISRDVKQIETLSVPVIKDSIMAIVAGSFNSRLQFRAVFNDTAGRVGAQDGQRYSSSYGSVNLSLALVRHLGIATDVGYSRVSIPLTALPIDAQGEIDGYSVRTSLQVWLPLINRTKRQ